MLASYEWLKQLSGVDIDVNTMAEKLTSAGIAIDAVIPYAQKLEQVIVVEVRGKMAHPTKDKLSLVSVFDGKTTHEIVCGAPNVPAPGARVLFATLGATLPNGMKIEERQIAGTTSRGMLCSEAELGIGSDSSGIVVLSDHDHAEVGAPAMRALGLEDFIFDVSLTPNRPDCLGHVGIAREVAALVGAKFSPKKATQNFKLETTSAVSASFADSSFNGAVRVTVDAPERCPRYAAAVVTGLRVGASPIAIRSRLHSLGVRAISTLVDATNWALLEWGYPTHAFDLRHVRGQHILVRLANEGETMATLDGIERKFTSDDLLICDAEGPVAVAGVMGGANSEIRSDTNAVLIETAYFEPRSVRRTSRRLGLHTDASHRFERGVDPAAVPSVLARVAELMHSLGHGKIAPVAIDVAPGEQNNPVVTLRHARLDAILGTHVEPAESKRVLESLGFAVVEQKDAHLRVEVPSWRPDITREIDLIEEVARIRGYDKIPVEVPHVRPSSTGTNARVRFARELKKQAAASGLSEAINYAFVSQRELENARAPQPALPIANPLSEERSVMRTSLLPGLAADIGRALRHQASRVRIFELARVFTPTSESLPREREIFGVMLAGGTRAWLGEGDATDFYDLKGVLESVFAPLVASELQTARHEDLATEHPELHPRRSAIITFAGKRVGVIGELHPDVIDAFSLPGRPMYAQVEVDGIFAIASAEGLRQFQSIPRYPSVTRDVAIVVDENIFAEEVAENLLAASDGLAEDVQVFDLFRGKGIADGQKSLAFRIIYRDKNATLTDDRVEKVHASVVQAIKEKFGAALRA